MEICIKKRSHKDLRLRFPTGLLFNRGTALLLSAQLRKHGIHLTSKQTSAFVTALKHYQKAHKDWVLVEVWSDDEEAVRIRL